MRISRTVTAASAIAIAAAFAATELVRAAADQVAFPEDFAKGVAYMSIDRAGPKVISEYYTSREAIEAAKKGTPLPSGTVITAVTFAAQLDAQGNPVKDANGRLIKTTTIRGYRVMAKRAGWGTEYPEGIRNGEWEYQVFRADKTPDPAANLTSCFDCHKPQASNDYVFSFDKLKLAAR
jgi:Cytochrome P460